MFSPDKDGVYARIDVARGRRAVALLIVGGLGALLIWMAFASLAGFAGRIGLLVMGVGMLIVGGWMRQAGNLSILLTDEGIFDSDGVQIAAMSDIQAIDRGAFAIKPSNGFSLKLKQKAPRAWRPGLWWRLGRRVGVGGIVNAGATKFMAEQIAMRLAD